MPIPPQLWKSEDQVSKEKESYSVTADVLVINHRPENVTESRGKTWLQGDLGYCIVDNNFMNFIRFLGCR
jgi:hypothetical protein